VSDAALDRAAGADESQTLALRTLVHDLRQPALAIGLLAEILGERHDLPDDVMVHASQLSVESRWIIELLGAAEGDRLANSTEPVPGQCSPARQALPGRSDVSAAARAAVTSAKSNYRGVVVLSAPARAVVTADRTSLRRAMSNLIENAMRAAGPTGHVRVEVGRDPDGGVRVVVEDDGPGFGRVQVGNRLGLTVVAQAVISTGGTIEIGASDLGGVRVTMHLGGAGRPSGGLDE
jgi:signal transduction histidine kinase